MIAREHILHKVRTALGHSAGRAAAPPPPARLRIPAWEFGERWKRFAAALEKLGGKAVLAAGAAAARQYVATLTGGRPAVASAAPALAAWGITSLPGVRSEFRDDAELRSACASADFGITTAEYALADTGSLALWASPEQTRLISVLPPVHVALVPASGLITGLDELLTLVPRPLENSSALVLVTGPSRTADIEQILVRGVHGPGEIHVIVVEEREERS
ncbi:MAG: lactate utilization protein [Bryobacterales bacterium]|nr:lactate utilization protein [Bryobacteraceae bacterium]MDW8131627.1 lactate utilization protein [Bryobacterales bacterium]